MAYLPKYKNFPHALHQASTTIPTDLLPDYVSCNSTTPKQERSSLVVAFQCTGCGQVVTIDGYCLCCPYDSDDDLIEEGAVIQQDHRNSKRIKEIK